MARIFRVPQARRDMREIFEYIARKSHSRAVAVRFIDRLNSRLGRYASQPEWGELCPDLGVDVVFGNYIVLYQPAKGGIRLLRVLDAWQDYIAIWWRGC